MASLATANIIVRADGGPTMGLGHVYRCRSLALMLVKDYRVDLITTPALRQLEADMREGFAAVTYLTSSEREYLGSPADSSAVIEYASAESPKPALIIVDGYHFGTSYQRALSRAGYKVLCIDDIHAVEFDCAAVLNHAGGVSESSYSLAPGTRLYHGLQYALIHPVYQHFARTRETIPPGRVFVCLGGADPQNHSVEVCERVLNTTDESVEVVAGAAFQGMEALVELRERSPGRLHIHQSIPTAEVLATMRRCRRGITSPSTVALEYFCISDEVYLFPHADNQQEFFQFCISSKLATPFSSWPVSNANRQVVRRVFDGLQGDRVRALIKHIRSGVAKKHVE